MIKLHAAWFEDSLFLWAETSSDERVTKKTLLDLAADLGVAEKSQSLRTMAVWLPYRCDTPIFSNDSIGADRLAPWPVIALPLDIKSGIPLLSASAGKRVIRPSLLIGADLSYWAAALRFAAGLGEMPQDIEQAFAKAGLSLFPARHNDLKTECSCPDWSNPCKHIAAVYYLLGEEFDRDPFLIFQLRGMSREEFLGILGESASPGIASATFARLTAGLLERQRRARKRCAGAQARKVPLNRSTAQRATVRQTIVFCRLSTALTRRRHHHELKGKAES
jgi:hypothetical protein